MSEIEDPVHQFAHPSYWTPHRLGDGDADVVPDLRPSDGDAKSAQDVLRDYSQRPGAGNAVETYNTGDEFTVDGHAPGTVLGFDIEYLYAWPDVEVDPADYKDVPIPEREYVGWPRTPTTTLESPSLMWYFRAASGAVVLGENRLAPRRIVGAHLGATIMGSECPGTTNGYVYLPSEFVVGEVAHTQYDGRRQTPVDQVLSRVNRVDVLVPGKAQTVRRPIILPKLKFGTQGSA